MQYRREIDGLRAYAVLPVIFFHAGFTAFSGGFVGVDVFFVISGYLITSIILQEKRTGSFSLLRFYERRVRRILPALFTVMLVCLPLAWMWLLPSELQGFSRSLVAVAAFASNFLFWRESGYFDTAVELKPLLHTWSLAVEEQYYLVFPVLLLLAWRLGLSRRWLLGLLAVAAVVSLAAAQWGAYRYPAATFFLLPTRGWELLIGVLLAFYLAERNAGTAPADSGRRWAGEALAAAGILLIAAAVFLFDETTPFPSLYALVPAVGTACIILFATPRTLVGRLLGSRLLVGIGLISYSAYLWHQPLFAFARHRSVGVASPALLAALSLLSIVLAYFSWRYVERPFRKREGIGRTVVFATAAGGSLFFVALGFTLQGSIGERIVTLPPNVQWESLGDKIREVGNTCRPSPVPGYDTMLTACAFGDPDSDTVVALYGDSHAQALLAELDKAFASAGIRGLRVRLGDCEVIAGFARYGDSAREREDCARGHNSLLAYLADKADAIVLIVRWTPRLYPIEGAVDQLGFDNGEGGVEYETPRRYGAIGADGRLSLAADAKREVLQRFVTSMTATGRPLVLVYPVPEVGWNVAKLNLQYYREHGDLLPSISTSHQRFEDRNRFVDDAFDGLGDIAALHRVRPERLLCDNFIVGRCAAQVDGIPLYFDDDHLSDAGAALVVREIMAAFGKPLPPSAPLAATPLPAPD